MYYCYAALQIQTNGIKAQQDYYGIAESKADMIIHLIRDLHAIILNLIDLTEEEYNEIYNEFKIMMR